MIEFEAGDLLAFYGLEWTSRLIEVVTRGPSHVGIVSRPRAAEGMLFESTTLCDLPDQITGRRTKGVQVHVPRERVVAYRGRVQLLRLVPVWRLSRHEAQLLANMLRHLHGGAYDLGGAVLSGTRVFKWTSLMPYGDLGSLFCSELCAAVLMRLGRLPLGNPATYNPASLVRALRRCGIYEPPVALTGKFPAKCIAVD